MNEEKIEALKFVGLILIFTILVSVAFNVASLFIAESFGFIGYIIFVVVLLTGLLYYIYKDECERRKPVP